MSRTGTRALPRGPQNLAAGLVLVAVAGIAWYLVQDLSIGRAQRMGPGYVPRVICYVLAFLGVAIAVDGLVRLGDGIARIAWKPLAIVTIAIVLFGLAIDRAGLLITGALLVLIAGAAAPDHRWKEGILFAVLMAIAAVAVFPYALGLAMPIWPELG